MAFVNGFKVAKEYIPGGLAEGIPDSRFRPKSIKKGTKVEMEHTKAKAVAREIAKDHLTEDPAYYTKLERVMGKEAAMAMSKSRMNRVVDAVVHRAGLKGGKEVRTLLRQIERDPYVSSISLVHSLRSKIQKGGDSKALEKLRDLASRHSVRNLKKDYR